MTTATIIKPAVNDRRATRQRNLRLGLQLGGVAIFMVAFSAVLWWSADVLCDWAGIGLNPNAAPRSEIRIDDPGIRVLEKADHE